MANTVHGHGHHFVRCGEPFHEGSSEDVQSWPGQGAWSTRRRIVRASLSYSAYPTSSSPVARAACTFAWARKVLLIAVGFCRVVVADRPVLGGTLGAAPAARRTVVPVPFVGAAAPAGESVLPARVAKEPLPAEGLARERAATSPANATQEAPSGLVEESTRTDSWAWQERALLQPQGLAEIGSRSTSGARSVAENRTSLVAVAMDTSRLGMTGTGSAADAVAASSAWWGSSPTPSPTPVVTKGAEDPDDAEAQNNEFPSSKYFQLRNKKTGHVLAVEDGKTLVMERDRGAVPEQLWERTSKTRTPDGKFFKLRNKASSKWMYEWWKEPKLTSGKDNDNQYWKVAESDHTFFKLVNKVTGYWLAERKTAFGWSSYKPSMFSGDDFLDQYWEAIDPKTRTPACPGFTGQRCRLLKCDHDSECLNSHCVCMTGYCELKGSCVLSDNQVPGKFGLVAPAKVEDEEASSDEVSTADDAEEKSAKGQGGVRNTKTKGLPRTSPMEGEEGPAEMAPEEAEEEESKTEDERSEGHATQEESDDSSEDRPGPTKRRKKQKGRSKAEDMEPEQTDVEGEVEDAERASDDDKGPLDGVTSDKTLAQVSMEDQWAFTFRACSKCKKFTDKKHKLNQYEAAMCGCCLQFLETDCGQAAPNAHDSRLAFRGYCKWKKSSGVCGSEVAEEKKDVDEEAVNQDKDTLGDGPEYKEWEGFYDTGDGQYATVRKLMENRHKSVVGMQRAWKEATIDGNSAVKAGKNYAKDLEGLHKDMNQFKKEHWKSRDNLMKAQAKMLRETIKDIKHSNTKRQLNFNVHGEYVGFGDAVQNDNVDDLKTVAGPEGTEEEDDGDNGAKKQPTDKEDVADDVPVATEVEEEGKDKEISSKDVVDEKPAEVEPDKEETEIEQPKDVADKEPTNQVNGKATIGEQSGKNPSDEKLKEQTPRHQEEERKPTREDDHKGTPTREEEKNPTHEDEEKRTTHQEEKKPTHEDEETTTSREEEKKPTHEDDEQEKPTREPGDKDTVEEKPDDKEPAAKKHAKGTKRSGAATEE